jgi:hypothetical protein
MERSNPGVAALAPFKVEEDSIRADRSKSAVTMVRFL